MRILHLDLDSVRPDHLGCYGYGRDTSPTLDRLAAEGRRYDACHCSDGPCLPSRTAMYTGRFGIATVLDLAGVEAPELWQGRSAVDRDPLVCSLLAQAAQRAVRFAAEGTTWWYLRTWHDCWHGIPAETLFDLEADARCTRDLADHQPALVERGRDRLATWTAAHLTAHGDPLDEVLAHGGPQAVKAQRDRYPQHLRDTGRAMPPGERF